MLVDLKNGKKFYSPDEQKVKAMHDALVAALRALDPAIMATVVAQSLAAVLCMVYEVSGHRHAADAMETWFAEELEWPTDERDVEAAMRDHDVIQSAVYDAIGLEKIAARDAETLGAAVNALGNTIVAFARKIWGPAGGERVESMLTRVADEVVKENLPPAGEAGAN